MSHKLLERQISRHFGGRPPPPELAGFLGAVGEAYATADADRDLLERSLELTSNELMRANDALRLQLSTLRGVFDSVPLAIMVVDFSGEQLHEVASNEALQPMRSFAADPDWPAICREVRAAGRPGRYEKQRRTAEGIEHHVVIVAPVAGRPDRYCIVIEDVTERRALEARLRVADRMASMGTIAAGVAHEINNPLSYVIGNLSHIQERFARLEADDVDLRDALADVREGAERVRRIVGDLRSFSRSPAKEERREMVELIPLVESCLAMAGNEIRHRARIVRDYDDVAAVKGDRGRLAQVFLNLLVNAAHAIPEGAAEHNEIRVSVRPAEPGWLSVQVRDSGSGIPEAIRERILEPFFTTKPAGVGTGLGLAIGNSIVQSMGGELTFESAEGVGTAFTVRLPAYVSEARAVRAAPAPAAPVTPVRKAEEARARILVIDDEVAVGKLLHRLLREHDVTPIARATDALSRLGSGERYDLIVCDLMMPELTGMDLHARLSELYPSQAERVVFMTGGTFTPRAREFVDAHRTRCIEKPIDPPILKRFISLALAQARQTSS